MYRPRVIGLALGGVAIAGVLIYSGAGLATWGALFASTILWPHLALWLGSRSANPYRTELASLMVDSALGGAWIALMQFNLLPSVALLIMLSMDKMAIGGARFLARCSGALVLACAAAAALNGFQVRPYTNMVQIIGSLPLIVFYPLVVGWTTYRLARRLREQNQILSEMSRTDHLSGLLNRRCWEEAVAAEFERCARTGACASLLMLDIDHFKSINDTFGHAAGDAVLHELPSIAGQGLRGVDVFGRFGGEEFLLVLPGTDIEGARLVAERVRAAVEAAQFPGMPAGRRVTVTLGVAERAPGEDTKSLLNRADRALYAGKGAGRNRVEVDEAPKG
jgi:diguanylate cyclase